MCDHAYSNTAFYEIVNDSGETVRICGLCYLIKNYTKKDIEHCVVCDSVLSQKEIIDKTWIFYNKNGYIPLPTDIDENVSIVKLTATIYMNFKLYTPFKIFFTKMVESNMICKFAAPIKCKTKKPLLLDYYLLPVHDFSDNQSVVDEIKRINRDIQKPMINVNKKLLEYYTEIDD